MPGRSLLIRSLQTVRTGVQIVLVLLTALSTLMPAALARAEQAPAPQSALLAAPALPRYFPETGYRIGLDQFFEYFHRRGGLRTFGYPVSRPFTLDGFTVQFFQRGIMQMRPDGSVTTLNVLDPGLMPYQRINTSTFPGVDRLVVAEAPSPDDPEYGRKILEFVRRYAPDEWEGHKVNFYQTFLNTVRFEDAFPNGDGDPALMPLINLEIWGAPTSRPAYDPRNHNFIYLRFQRGIMHYDATTGTTQGLLLADYLKAIITGKNLPPDLEEQARSSRYYKQYNRFKPNWVEDPQRLPATNLHSAFEPIERQAPRAASPEYGVKPWVWFQPATTDRDLKLAVDAGFQWVRILFPWRAMERDQRGVITWDEADRVVVAAKKHGLKVIARVDYQPQWSRADRTLQNGPPDNVEDYANFVRALLNRYASDSPIGRIHAIEVWNEPNLAREWGGKRPDPAGYVALLKATYEAAKSIDPSIVVISAGLTPTGVYNDQAMPDDEYLRQMYAAGARGYFDALGAHAPGYKAPPELSPQQVAADPALGGHPSFAFRRVEQLREIMVANGDADKQIWILEFGWTSDPVHPEYAWHRVSEEEKAEYIIRAFRYAKANWSPWIGVMTVWNLAEPGSTPDKEEYWWAITNPDGTPRPAYTRILQARAAGLLR